MVCGRKGGTSGDLAAAALLGFVAVLFHWVDAEQEARCDRCGIRWDLPTSSARRLLQLCMIAAIIGGGVLAVAPMLGAPWPWAVGFALATVAVLVVLSAVMVARTPS